MSLANRYCHEHFSTPPRVNQSPKHSPAQLRCGFITQVQCFGLAMVKLDIRQESSRHSDVLDTITRYLGLGSYK